IQRAPIPRWLQGYCYQITRRPLPAPSFLEPPPSVYGITPRLPIVLIVIAPRSPSPKARARLKPCVSTRSNVHPIKSSRSLTRIFQFLLLVYGTGLTDADLKKAQVGISSVYASFSQIFFLPFLDPY